MTPGERALWDSFPSVEEQREAHRRVAQNRQTSAMEALAREMRLARGDTPREMRVLGIDPHGAGAGLTAARMAAERIVEKLSEWGEPWPPTQEGFAATSSLGGERWIRQCLRNAGMDWKAATAAAGARRTANRK